MPDEKAMLLSRQHIIFVHIPKTAGNLLTRRVLLRHSEDWMTVAGHQDGINRFEVAGEITRKKHMTVRDYADLMDVSDFFVVSVVRDPFERLLSLFFSPHNWKRPSWRVGFLRGQAKLLGLEVNVGSGHYRDVEPRFSVSRFSALLDRALSQREFLEGFERTRGLEAIRYSELCADSQAVLARHGITVGPEVFGTRLNVSSKLLSERERREAYRAFESSKHWEDVEFLNRYCGGF